MQLRFLFLSSFSLDFIDSELGRNGKGRRVHPLIQYLGLFQGRTNRRAWSALASDLLWSPIPPLDAPDCSEVSPLYISFALDLLCLLGLHKIVITLLKTTALTYSSGHMGPSFNPLRLNMLCHSIILYLTKFRVSSPSRPFLLVVDMLLKCGIKMECNALDVIQPGRTRV